MTTKNGHIGGAGRHGGAVVARCRMPVAGVPVGCRHGGVWLRAREDPAGAEISARPGGHRWPDEPAVGELADQRPRWKVREDPGPQGERGGGQRGQRVTQPGGLRHESVDHIQVDPGEPHHPLRAQPLDVAGVADRADPAPHRGQRPVELGGDPPVPGPAGAGQQRRPDHRGRVGPAQRGRSGQQHVGDPAGAAASPPRPQGQPGGAVVAHRAGAGVTPRAQRAGASRAGQRAGGQSGLGPNGVGDPDHRGTVEARRTSMVYQHRRRQGPAGVAADPARRPDGPAGPTPIGLGTLTTRRSRRMRSAREERVRRHGGDADEPHAHPPVVVTVKGAEVAGWSSLREAVNTRSSRPGPGTRHPHRSPPRMRRATRSTRDAPHPTITSTNAHEHEKPRSRGSYRSDTPGSGA